MSETAYGRLLAEGGTPEQFLLVENGRASNEFDPVDRALAKLVQRALRGGRLVETKQTRTDQQLKLLGLNPSDEEMLASCFRRDALQAQGAWWIADAETLKPAFLNLPASILAGHRFPASSGGEDSLRVELDDPHHLFVSVLLQPLFQKLLLPLELRGAAAGKKDRDTRRKMWHEAKQLYDDLGLDVHRAFTRLRSGKEWAMLRHEGRVHAKYELIKALASAVTHETTRRYRALQLAELIHRFYAKSRKGVCPTQREVLTKPLQRTMAAYFGGSWLRFLEYIDEEPSPNEEITTALPESRLYVGGSAKVKEIAAAKGIDPAEVEKMLASFYGRSSAKSPVEQRVEVCKRYWDVFDAVHAAQSPGMRSLWGFVDEGATYSLGSPSAAYEPQARPHLLPDDVADEIEELWDSEIVKRWPERIVSTTHPHAMFADTFGPALQFWHSCALTAWFVCEGPYSRTDLPGLASFYEDELLALDELGTPVHKQLFTELSAAESRLGPLEELTSELTSDRALEVGIRISIGVGTRRAGFEILRDIITRHRRGWTKRYLDAYLHERWHSELKEVAWEFNRFLAAKGKPPTAKQFVVFGETAVDHWFGGSIADAYAAFGEKSPVTQTRVSLMPANRAGLAGLVYRELGGRILPPEAAWEQRELSNAQFEIRRRADAAPKFVQLQEALGRVPTPKEFGADRWGQPDEVEILWTRFVQAVERSLPAARVLPKSNSSPARRRPSAQPVVPSKPAAPARESASRSATTPTYGVKGSGVGGLLKRIFKRGHERAT